MTIYLSKWSTDTTVNRIVDVIKSSGLVYFETVAHDSIAEANGVKISPTRQILFEDPILMTKLISCRQTTALDLPLKVLVWEENEDVYVGFFDPKVMRKRYMLHECDHILDSMSRIKIKVVNDALREEY